MVAMRATYRREMAAKTALEAKGIESFIPMKTVTRPPYMKKTIKVPVIHNLIFVHATGDEIREAKTCIAYLQYMMDRCGEKEIPVIVPDRQMEAFMQICNSCKDDIEYLSGQDTLLLKGDKVRIIAGILKGHEGTLVKVPGSRKRRVAVSIDGIIGVTTASILPGMLEVIGKATKGNDKQ